jgi:preprotein translocase subunit SecE
MALNREQRRMLQRQGEMDDTGELVRQRRTAPPAAPTREERTRPTQFVKEVRSELRKVAWPTRQETFRYTIIVLVTVIVLTALIAGLDWLFSELVLKLFQA